MSFRHSGQLCLASRAVEILSDQFRKWPIKAAADAIGVNPETLKNWFDGTSKPSSDHLSRLFHRLGPKFYAYVMSPFEEAHLETKAARLKVEIERLEAELAAVAKNRSRVRADTKRTAHKVGPLVDVTGGKDEA